MEYTSYSVGAAQVTLDSYYIQEVFGRCVHLVYKSSTLQSSTYVHSMFKAPPTAKLENKIYSCCFLTLMAYCSTFISRRLMLDLLLAIRSPTY